MPAAQQQNQKAAAMTKPKSGQEITFGPFCLYPDARILLRSDKPVQLGSRAREMLLLLVERAGEVVKKRELMARVWPDTIVEEGTLRVHIASLRKVLGDGLGGVRYVENVTGFGYRFIAPVTRSEEIPLPVTATLAIEPQHNIPTQLTRMIGRAPVVASLASRLPQRRFVTLVGPGGIGKTTVALAAANDLHESYPHGVCVIDLSSITDPSLISGTLAAGLGLASVSQDPLPQVIEFLEQKQMLVVLDSCEHLIVAAALLAEKILGGAPSVHVIATSREPLRALNEWVLRLAPLEIPPLGAVLTVSEVLGFSAVELFVERARASLDTFELNDADVPVLADICRRLDGLPLAIELAAARVDLFNIRALSSRLDDRLGLLTRGRRTAERRHQTLRATLDWSYEILSVVEKIALRRLAVFAGAFDMKSAGGVLVDDEINEAEVPDILMDLAAKSLLAAQLAGEQVLYRLLDTSRAYALEKLADSQESAAIKRRHAQLCYSWGSDELDREAQTLLAWAAQTSHRIEDVRAALDWCFSPEGDPVLGMNLTAASAPVWFHNSFLDEYRARLERALQSQRDTPNADAVLEVHLNGALGDVLLHTVGVLPCVTAAFNKTLELAERLGSAVHQRRALCRLWASCIGTADYRSALKFADSFCQSARSSGDSGALLAGDRVMAISHQLLGNHATARDHAERALQQPVEPVAPASEYHFHFDHRIAVRASLASVLWIQGFPDQAIRVSRENLECAQSMGYFWSLCYALNCMGSVVIWMGDVPEAKRLIAMLLGHSRQHSLAYWQFWGRCLEAGLARNAGELKAARQVLNNPLCSPLHQESVATFQEALATPGSIVRAQTGLAGWCEAELLRIKAETLLRENGGHESAAEELLQQSLDTARKQGALSWELRTATSLARLWHDQRRTRAAHDLLASVYAQFTEGFGTRDLVNAAILLEDMTVKKSGTR
jgi:predicted ATPase/DNA-binding winged helix-turn-helix (wHTH) protein